MRRYLGAIAEFIVAIIISYLFSQVAARLVPTTDRLFFSICTVSAYTLGVILAVYFPGEIFDISGNFWFLVAGATFGGIVVFAAYSFENFIGFDPWEAFKDYAVSVALLGPSLGSFAFNIGPKPYGLT
jgi:hypothetical protein